MQNQKKIEMVCAWCEPTVYTPDGSHCICDFHWFVEFFRFRLEMAIVRGELDTYQNNALAKALAALEPIKPQTKFDSSEESLRESEQRETCL